MADTDDKGTWPEVERRKGPKDRRVTDDRRNDDRVVTENEPRRQKPDRRND